MKNKIILSILAIALIPFLLSACGIKKTEIYPGATIKVASDCTWPPMEIVNENKELVGFDIDLIKAIAREANLNVDISNTAWDGIFAGLGSGEYNAIISSVTINDERKAKMDFSDPYLNAGQVLIVKKDNNQIKSLSDLKGKAVGSQINTTGATEIQKVEGVICKTYDEIAFAVEDLAKGRIDGVVCDTPTAANYVLKKDKYKNILQLTGEPFTSEYFGIVTRKGDTDLLNAINLGLKKVKESGELQKLEDKWLR